MACKIRMGEREYTQEEFDSIPLVEKLEAILNSPDIERYVELGVAGLSGGAVFTTESAVDPEVQMEYDTAIADAADELTNTLNHAKDIQKKIRDVFGKHMSEEQVEMALIMLDVMANAWAMKNNTIKEAYYLRYEDVQDSGTADELLARIARSKQELEDTIIEEVEEVAVEEVVERPTETVGVDVVSEIPEIPLRHRRSDGRVIGGIDGWKLRLNLKNLSDDYQSVVDWLDSYFETTKGGGVRKFNGVTTSKYYGFNESSMSAWKLLSGGEMDGSQFTIYIGSREDALKFTEDVKNSPIYHLLDTSGLHVNTDVEVSNGIYGRVDLPGISKTLPSNLYLSGHLGKDFGRVGVSVSGVSYNVAFDKRSGLDPVVILDNDGVPLEKEGRLYKGLPSNFRSMIVIEILKALYPNSIGGVYLSSDNTSTDGVVSETNQTSTVEEPADVPTEIISEEVVTEDTKTDELSEAEISDVVKETYDLLHRLFPGEIGKLKPHEIARVTEINSRLSEEESEYDTDDRTAVARIAANLDENESEYDDEANVSDQDILQRISDNLDEVEDEYDTVDEVVGELMDIPEDTPPEVSTSVNRIKNLVKRVVRGAIKIKDVVRQFGRNVASFVKELALRVIGRIEDVHNVSGSKLQTEFLQRLKEVFDNNPDISSIGSFDEYVKYLEDRYGTDFLSKLFYTGTRVKFDNFDKSFFYSGEGAMAYGAGFYLTPSKNTALGYSRQSVINGVIGEMKAQLKEMSKHPDIVKLEELDSKLSTLISEYEDRITITVNSNDNFAKQIRNTIQGIVRVLKNLLDISGKMRMKSEISRIRGEMEGIMSSDVYKEYDGMFEAAEKELAKLFPVLEDLDNKTVILPVIVNSAGEFLIWEKKASSSLLDMLEAEGVSRATIQDMTEGEIYSYLSRTSFKGLSKPTGNKQSIIRGSEGKVVTEDIMDETLLSEWFRSKGYVGIKRSTLTNSTYKMAPHIDAVFNQPEGEEQVIVFEGRDTLILGSKTDLSGFRSFVDTTTTGERNSSSEEVSNTEIKKSKGVAKVREVADKFKRERNIKRPSHPFVKKLESWMSKEIANAYANAKAVDNSPASIAAYNALEEESLAQYQYIVDSGMKIERWLGEGEPYSSSREMLEDLEKGHMYFLPNDSAFGDGTVDTEGRLGLKKVGVKLDDGYEMTFSEVFRVVHDYFGHGLLGNEFGAIGEENATLQHLELFTAKAAPALIFQTRGQNSWVNYSDTNSEANAKFKEARKLDKEGKHEEAAKVRQEGQQLFKFAEPKDSIFEDIYNFKFYGTVQRIREERETKNHPNYIDSRGSNENNDVQSLHPTITSRRAGKYGENITRRSVQEVRRIDGHDVEVVAEYTFDSKLDTLIKKVFPNYQGSKKVYEIKDGAVYSKLLQKHSEGNKFNASVTLHSDEEFSKMRLFVTEDGSTGVTLTNEGFLGGAYSSMIVKSPNSLAQMMFLGIKEGAITAEAFDTILPDYYSMFGFKAVSRTAFNDEFRPMKANGALADWDYETYKDFNGGRPDVVFMIYDGGPRETIEERTGMFDMYKTYQKSFTQSFDEWGYDAATNVMNIETYNRSLTDGYGDVTQSPTIEDEVNSVIDNDGDVLFETTSTVQRAAVQGVGGNKFILHALQAPDVGSLVHEFMHVAEQDLDDMDLETLEAWSGHRRGTVEFKEAVADGMVKFVSEDHPEINAINEVFSKIAKLLKSLYRGLVASPLDLKMDDNVRMVYAKILGAEEAFSRRVNTAENQASEMSQSERAAFIKDRHNDPKLKKYAPSQLKSGTKVVRKDGSIGIVGVDDLSGTTAKDRKDGIFELLSYPTLKDVGLLLQSKNKPQSSLKNKKKVVPSCT